MAQANPCYEPRGEHDLSESEEKHLNSSYQEIGAKVRL